MSGPRFRLAEGGRIDRAAPLGFSFNGESFTGYAGDTLASALMANGVRLVGRSFKYHRPRGIVAPFRSPAASNTIVRAGSMPLVRRSRMRWSSSAPADTANPTCAPPRSNFTPA